MRPISLLAAFGLAALPFPAVAASSDASAPPSTAAAVRIALGNPTDASWLGLRIRPFSVARLIGRPGIDADRTARSPILGNAPEDTRLISFARGSIDAPSPSLTLRDAPRFSRQPGKQIQDVEAGLRTSLAGDAIALQAGVSYNKFRNLQTSLRQGNRVMSAVAGKAKIYGIEGLARWSADERISLFATYAWREGRLKNRVRDGRRFRLSPDRSAAVGAVLLLPAGAGRIAFTPSVGWRSAMGIGAGMDGRGSGALLNAQLGYALSDGFEIEALASNLLARSYGAAGGSDAPALIAGEPQVFGVRARLRFGALR